MFQINADNTLTDIGNSIALPSGTYSIIDNPFGSGSTTTTVGSISRTIMGTKTAQQLSPSSYTAGSVPGGISNGNTFNISAGGSIPNTGVEYTSDTYKLFDKGLQMLGSYINNPMPGVLQKSTPGTFISQIDYRGATNVYSPLIQFGTESTDKFANINDPDDYYHY